MHDFLINNRSELIERCKLKVAQRPQHAATAAQLQSGIPQLIGQLIQTLSAESQGRAARNLRISCGSVEGFTRVESEIGLSAKDYGKQLLDLGYKVDDVVYGYGDLCQAISDLAVERDAPFMVEEFRTLNRCLDNAIAEAVTSFSKERDVLASRRYLAESNERLGFLLHELRNSLMTAKLAVTVLERGQLPIAGATGGVLRRSLVTLSFLVKHALEEVRAAAAFDTEEEMFSLATFLEDAESAALLHTESRDCSFIVNNAIEPDIDIKGDRHLLMGALENLLQNAFKYTQPGTEVSLSASLRGEEELIIEVQDHCGGLAPGVEEGMFRPFTRGHGDKSGLGLGLSITKQNVEATGGGLSVRNLPGAGCIFTISLPLHEHLLAPETVVDQV